MPFIMRERYRIAESAPVRALTLLLGIGLIAAAAALWRDAPPSAPPLPQASVTEFGDLLRAGHHIAASMRLREHCRADAAQWQRCRLQLLEYAAGHVDSGDAGALLPLLELLLEHTPDDAHALLLKARALRSQGKFEAALELLAGLRNRALRDDAALAPYGDLEHQFTTVAEQRLAELRQRQESTALAELLRHLGELDPDNGQWFYQLAETQLQAGQREAARDSLYRIYYHPQWGERAQALEREHLSSASPPAPKSTPTAARPRGGDKSQQRGDSKPWQRPIPLRQHGRHFIVELHFGPVTLPFLLDTGSELTVIDHQALQRSRMAYRHRGRTLLITAGGSVPAQLIQVGSLGAEGHLSTGS